MEIKALYELFLTCTGISTDTRKIEVGVLFFALKGPNFNGNQYASLALEKGAKYCIVDEIAFKENDFCIFVNDALQTLQDLANYHRKELDIPVIGIAGSNGKTTTKELTNAVLSTKFKTFATIGNLNNHIGVPLSLLSISKSYEIAILELGANHVNELALLCKIAEPSHGLITNNGLDHLEGYGSFEGVVQGNSEIFYWLLKNNGTPFVNSNDEILMRMAARFKNPLTYGSDTDFSYAKIIENHFFIKIKTDEGEIMQTQLVGEYNVDNINTALAVGKHFGVNHAHACKAIAAYKPANNRSQLIEKGTNKIILDCYNANPSSMKLAIESFAKMNVPNKVLILGDMYELGDYSLKEHENVVEYATELGFTKIFLAGIDFANTKIDTPFIKKFKDRAGLETFFQNYHLENHAILIKGSRGMAMEKLIDFM
ncbi:MAG: UDP-N-acetylmuramoyl-tripeptide--D-alanyl-D-alanine ligase [Cytophagales bacterium]